MCNHPVGYRHGRHAWRVLHQYFALGFGRDLPQAWLRRAWGSEAHPARQRENAFVTVPAVIARLEAGRRRLLALALTAGALGAVTVSGCGEKSEPAIHPPTTAATTTTPPAATTTAPAVTRTAPTPTAPVPKTTP